MNNSIISPGNGLSRTDGHAIGLFALVADHGQVVELFILVENGQPGKAGIVSPKQIK
ncbi:MAG: hypothetical protein MI802_14755 [Desulfobacterales bacterium]|nr:hypothetical protein [Desulfobacterales bacterium]